MHESVFIVYLKMGVGDLFSDDFGGDVIYYGERSGWIMNTNIHQVLQIFFNIRKDEMHLMKHSS